MPDEPRVQELLEELLDRQTTPEEVCGACPELLPAVRQRWRQICRARAELDAMLPVWPNGSPPTPPEELALPEVPGYKVEAVLGHGGMGVVFRARHLRLGRLVALKMTLAGAYASPHEQERFRREAETVAALRHANVVQVYDVGDWAGRPYFTMELIEGGSLAHRLAGVQPAPQAAALLATLAEAVHAAHQGGIVHRDLKPANILFLPDGTPKITDFGLARRLEGSSGLTLSGVPMGTPCYMAPEQARGQSRAIGPAADVYALGVILYEMLTGRTPFRGETTAETLQQVIHHEPVPPARLNRKVPRDLQTICLTCLQKEPRLRYVTAAALADDLRCFLRGDAITARPEGRLVRWARRISRQPLLAGLVVSAALSTLALAGGGGWLVTDRSTKAQTGYDDVRDMVRYLNQSKWPEAAAARDRANGRLGDSAPAELRRLIDRGSRDLELGLRLEALRLKELEAISGGVPLATYDQEFLEAFRTANLGTSDDNPELVASRIRESDIRTALIDALDRYSLFLFPEDPGRATWALKVASLADPDQTDWRHSARDREVIKNKAALKQLIATLPGNDPSLIPPLALETYVNDDADFSFDDRLKLLKRIHQVHPGDFWINLQFGVFLQRNKKSPEGLGYIQAAMALRPESAIAHYEFAVLLWDNGRHEEAMEQFQRATQLDPTINFIHQVYVNRLLELGKLREGQGREDAFVWLSRAVEVDPKLSDSQKHLRNYCLRHGRFKEARQAWQAMLAAGPPKHDAYYGYAELCLFVDDEVAFSQARQDLLKRFGATTDPRIAERTSRACLLAPATGEELKTAVALADRAVAAANLKQYEDVYGFFLFVGGLAEYRQGHFEKAIAIMKGPAGRALSSCPQLVIAMALHQLGREQEARQTLAAAVMARDWSPALCNSPVPAPGMVVDPTNDRRIYHVLRREAERLMLPNLSAFLAGTYQPHDNDERCAFVGACQFMDRTVALARLYADVFTADPSLMTTSRFHRYSAVKAAARAGCGHGTDAVSLGEAERARWRGQALDWLRQELIWYSKALDNENDRTKSQVLQRLRPWETEADLADLREPGALNKLPPDERKRWLELWAEVRGVLARQGKTP